MRGLSRAAPSNQSPTHTCTTAGLEDSCSPDKVLVPVWNHPQKSWQCCSLLIPWNLPLLFSLEHGHMTQVHIWKIRGGGTYPMKCLGPMMDSALTTTYMLELRCPIRDRSQNCDQWDLWPQRTSSPYAQSQSAQTTPLLTLNKAFTLFICKKKAKDLYNLKRKQSTIELFRKI